MGLIELKEAASNTFICDQTASKFINALFKNIDYLYSVISSDPLLRSCFSLPMNCLVKYKGHCCLVTSRIEPKAHENYNQ